MKIYLQKDGVWTFFEADDLSSELTKRNISIGARAIIGAGASIGEGAIIGARARIGADYDCLVIGSLGSRRAPLTLYYHDGEMWAGTGCFLGTAEDFIKQVKKVHGDNEHGKAYRAAVEFGKKVLRKRDARAEAARGDR